MEQETVCSHCGEAFSSKGKYKYHYRRVHQMEIKIRSTDNTDTAIVRSMNDKFVCLCGNEYVTYAGLHRHKLNCQEWKDIQMDDRNNEQGISL